MDTNHDLSTIPKNKKQVKEIKDFICIYIFIIVNSIIIFINLKYSPFMVFLSTFSWGIGLFFMRCKSFNFPFFGIRIGKRERFKNLWSKKN
jgi:predicted membrane channel-forming protein YqfA (hemolysin III family)